MIFCKQCVAILFACSSFFLQSPQLPAEGNNQETPLFDESAPLTPLNEINEKLVENSFDSAVTLGDIKEPENVTVQYFEEEIIFHIAEEEETNSVICHFHGTKPHCTLLDDEDVQDIAANPLMEPLHEWEMPLDSWENQSNEGTDRLKTRLKLMGLWASAILATHYALKKILNKIVKGNFIVNEKHHHHFFKTPHELEHSLQNLNELLAVTFPLLKENITQCEPFLTNDLIENSHPHVEVGKDRHQDLFALTIAGYQKAISQHACHLHHDHHHDEQPLQDKTPKGVLKKINYIAHDFYHESFEGIVEFVRPLFQRKNFNQAMQFAELAVIKSFHEKGLIISLGSGVFIITTQAAVETLEFIILGPGVHLFCNVGNAIALSTTTSAYVLYFYIKNNRQVSYLPWKERMNTILKSLSLSIKSQKLNYQKIEKQKNLSLNDQFLLTLTLLQKSVEMKLKFARNSSRVPVKLSRKLAGRLGKLRKELGTLYLHFYANTFKAWPHDLQKEILSWLKRLEDIHQSIEGKNTL